MYRRTIEESYRIFDKFFKFWRIKTCLERSKLNFIEKYELPCRLTGDQTFMRLQRSSVICCIRNVSYMGGLRQRERRLITKLRIYFETFAFGCKDISNGEQTLDATLLNLLIYAV